MYLEDIVAEFLNLSNFRTSGLQLPEYWELMSTCLQAAEVKEHCTVEWDIITLRRERRILLLY